MRERIRKDIVYKFEELSEEGKEKALEGLCDINISSDWWDSTYEDAKNIGLKITSFDIDRGAYCKGRFTESAEGVAKNILSEHGKDCESYKTATSYLKELEELREKTRLNDSEYEEGYDDLDTEDIDAEFLQSLLEDYRIILTHEYEYLTSREAIKETIDANEYEFTEEGKLI
jgi:hypothetical protein